MENHKAGFPPFPHPLEIPSGFPHSHGYGDDYHLYKTGHSQPITRPRATFTARGL